MIISSLILLSIYIVSPDNTNYDTTAVTETGEGDCMESHIHMNYRPYIYIMCMCMCGPVLTCFIFGCPMTGTRIF